MICNLVMSPRWFIKWSQMRHKMRFTMRPMMITQQGLATFSQCVESYEFHAVSVDDWALDGLARIVQLWAGRKASQASNKPGLFTVEQCTLNLRLSIRDRSGGRSWQAAGQSWCELNSNLALISADNLCSRLVLDLSLFRGRRGSRAVDRR